MPVRINGGVFNDQMVTGSLRHFVLEGADFSGAVDVYGQPVPGSAAEIIFTNISEDGFIDIMNPNQYNLSFALEINRSHWDGPSLTMMVQSLGTDVGIDHINCAICTVIEVPYIWNLGAGGPTSFLDLSDTPATYVGSAGYAVTVNPGATGLIFTPIAAGSADYIPVTPGIVLSFSTKYFITSSGIVTLPIATGSGKPAGTSIIVTKPISATVFINTTGVNDIISTDLGTTDSLEFDATQEVILVFDGTSTWVLQIGSHI